MFFFRSFRERWKNAFLNPHRNVQAPFCNCFFDIFLSWFLPNLRMWQNILLVELGHFRCNFFTKHIKTWGLQRQNVTWNAKKRSNFARFSLWQGLQVEEQEILEPNFHSKLRRYQPNRNLPSAHTQLKWHFITIETIWAY